MCQVCILLIGTKFCSLIEKTLCSLGNVTIGDGLENLEENIEREDQKKSMALISMEPPIKKVWL